MSCLESIIRFKLQWFKSRECVCLTDHTVLELLVFDREKSTRWRDDRWDKLNYKQYQTEMINTLILTTINDLLTFLRRFRSHVIFQIQRGAGWACEDYRCSNHRQPRPTQTLLKFYPELPLFICSSASGTLLSRYSYSSLAPLLVKSSDFHVGVCLRDFNDFDPRSADF